MKINEGSTKRNLNYLCSVLHLLNGKEDENKLCYLSKALKLVVLRLTLISASTRSFFYFTAFLI